MLYMKSSWSLLVQSLLVRSPNSKTVTVMSRSRLCHGCDITSPADSVLGIVYISVST